MAIATYNTDLATVTLVEAPDTFVEMDGYTLGNSGGIDTDLFIQGTSCATSPTNRKTGVGFSIAYDYGTPIAFSTGDCFFAWMQLTAGNGMATYANGGYRAIIGATTSDWNAWIVGGSDYGRNPYGGWTNVVVDPTYPADYTLGTPGNLQFFGVAWNTVSDIVKGNPLCMDACRWGRGEIYVEFGELGNYGTFEGMSSANDNILASWGLFQESAGSYLWKGLISLGTITNPVDFRDANKNIIIDDTARTYKTFNKVNIVNTSSVVYWTGINITSLGTLAKGEFEVVDNALIYIDGCTFTDMGTFTFQSSGTVTNSTFRRTERVNQGDAIFTDCTFDRSEPLSATNLDLVSYSNFIMTPTSGHGIVLTSSISGSYNFDGNTFENYDNLSGSNYTAIYNNSGNNVIIYIGGDGDTPSITDGIGSTTTVINARSITLTGLIAGSEVRIYSTGTTTELAGIETSTSSFIYSYPFADAGNGVDIVVHNIQYEYLRIVNYMLPSSSSSIPIQQRFDRNYINPL